MRIAALLSFLAILALNCGKDNSTNGNNGITISIAPGRGVVDFGDTFHFDAIVEGTSDKAVIWKANNIAGGDSVFGIIDITGNYIAPATEPPNTDSVRISAELVSDPAKRADAWAILVDPSKIYVNIFGSDSTGSGSLNRPYRTITKALTRAHSGQTIFIGPGDYNLAGGEIFPLRLSSGIGLRGAGSDSTFVTGPGSVNPPFDAVIEVNGDAITVERLYIRSSNSLGIGVWLRPGIQTKLLRNQISGNRIGVYTSGAAVPRTVLDGNRIIGDSIGIVTADSSRPIIRNSYIFDCPKYGMEIRDLSQPDLGVNDTTGAGHDTIQQCGDNAYRWLIYNSSPDTIWAIGNTWQYQILSENDLIIYDDEESGVSGPVIIEQR